MGIPIPGLPVEFTLILFVWNIPGKAVLEKKPSFTHQKLNGVLFFFPCLFFILNECRALTCLSIPWRTSTPLIKSQACLSF